MPREERHVDVDGVEIAYTCWGEAGRPGLVLVHGGAAHRGWFDHVAPQLVPQYRVAALDLSGHGDSGRRGEYSIDGWTGEVLAVADDAGFPSPPVVIGHSMGGFVAVATAARAGDRVGGLVILDSPIVSIDPEVEAARLGQFFGRPRTYPDVDAGVARFRTVPEQHHYEPYVLDHVARTSLRAVDGGVTWKFDPPLFLAIQRAVAVEYLGRVRCRVALFASEHGLVTPDIGRTMYERLGRVAPVIEIPEAGHHLMLDQPLLLVTALRTLLADWEHSVPFRPEGARAPSR